MNGILLYPKRIATLIGKAILASLILLILLLYAMLSNKRLLVISLPQGTSNLGNILFLFSNFICFALENNYEVLNPTFYKYADYFKTTSSDFFCRYPPQRGIFPKNSLKLGKYFLKLISGVSQMVKKLPKNNLFQTFELKPEERLNLDSKEFLNAIRGNRLTFFKGLLFVDEKDMTKYASKIKKHFIPRQKYEQLIDSPIRNLRKSSDIIFGIVVRRGDYKHWRVGKYFYDVSVYVQAMHQLENLFPEKKVSFFICSDEELNTNEFRDFNFIFRGKHDLENRYSLAQCDYMLSVPSTYGGWAAFYGEVPIYIFSGPKEAITLRDFRTVNNHTDLRDSSFSPDIDITKCLMQK